MARRPKPWYRKSRRSWFVQVDGKQVNLGPDKKSAFERFYELMREPKKPAKVSTNSVAVLFDEFLDWTQKHREKRTYEWYQDRLQRFLRTISTQLTVDQLKPYHIKNWLDANPDWSDSTIHGSVVAVQRAFRWAQKMGYIDRSPVRFVEKPQMGQRDQIITCGEFHAILCHVRDQEFRDLLDISWEAGCRPQESLRIEARHVDVKNARWIFPPKDAKGKCRPRSYISPKRLSPSQSVVCVNGRRDPSSETRKEGHGIRGP